MSFSNKPQTQVSKNHSHVDITQSFHKIEPCMEKKNRRISKKPYKILDAPNLQDDFYLNLIDWS
jgi:cell division cycle 20-like protein 1 (cofactor of APC complex)